ncbi:MAG: TonB family protein [Bdellovibrionales bacterium]|nr:TonB family protein [Bdellovibrionales bacterium]
MSRNSFDGLDWINFKASGLDFVETESKTGRFIGVSIVFHATLFILTSLVVIPALEPKKFETVSFDLMEAGSAPAATSVANPISTPVSQPAPAKVARPVSIASPTVKIKSAAKSSPRVLSEKGKQPKAIAKVVSKIVAPVSEVSVPQTIDDITSPQLDEEAIRSAPIGSIDDKDFTKDFDAIDSTSKKQIALAQMQLAAQTSEVETETNKSLGAAAAANKMEMESLGLAAAALRAKNQKNSLHQAVAARGYGQGQGEGQGEGLGAGHGQGPIVIRPIQDLRQLPGNPRPEYSAEERLKGNQGRAIFLAYVSKAGRLSEFKLSQSTGYRNLDYKTLAALKQWKFFPGQEGWVEIPIQWDLRGGAQEKPTLLRRTNI